MGGTRTRAVGSRCATRPTCSARAAGEVRRPRPSMTPAYDLVVIGGGITGLGIARLAARNGYRCAVLERGDLAAGASSGSSHMLHGGLRYLEHARFTLVREALAERRALHHMAPGLTRPQRFMVPLYRGDRVGP